MLLRWRQLFVPIATLNMVRLDRRQRESLQTQLYREIRRLIMSGQLTAGVRLPSTRDLVTHLGISRNTIVMPSINWLLKDIWRVTSDRAYTFRIWISNRLNSAHKPR